MPQRWVADQELLVAQESGDQRPEQGTLPPNIVRRAIARINPFRVFKAMVAMLVTPK